MIDDGTSAEVPLLRHVLLLLLYNRLPLKVDTNWDNRAQGKRILIQGTADEGHDDRVVNRNYLISVNRKWWDERAPSHTSSPFYRIDELITGQSLLDDFECAELVPQGASSLVHLQCHIGTDTISWAWRGLEVTGLDFSVAAHEQAKLLAATYGVEAKWVASDVYRAPERLKRTFDVVYTGRGALNRLDDISRRAEGVARLLNPGGRLSLVEFHPISWVLPDDGWGIVNDYFSSDEPYIEDSIGGS